MTKEITLDLDRQQRTGLSEAILCHGKSTIQLQAIIDKLQAQLSSQHLIQQQPTLFTRLTPSQFSQLQVSYADFNYDPLSNTGIYHQQSASLYDNTKPQTPSSEAEIAIVTGGSSDIPVAKEASRTLQCYQMNYTEIYDIGVAGLWRLEAKLELLKEKKIIICVAGMDAALPTVIGGLVKALIIAVPSSVGYGMAKAGETALNSLLCSCAQGIVVVNIDNGFGAACAAVRALQINK